MSSPYMKFWVGDYLSSARVMSLTPLAELAYFRLILWCWQSKGGLPNNDTSLASLCRLSGRQWATIRSQILPLFSDQDGCLFHPKVEEQRKAAEAVSRCRAEAGRLGGLSKSQANAKAKGVAKRSAPEPEPSLEPKLDKDDDRYSGITAIWNEQIVPVTNAPKVRGLNPARKQKLRRRLAEDKTFMTEVLTEAAKAGSFVKESTWFTFDWILNPANLAKFLEGNYRDREEGTSEARYIRLSKLEE